jgi:hypothetical protein
MPSLHELQRRFLADLLSEDGATLLPWVSDHGAAADRLNVYRDNCREGFLTALAAGYPVLKRLVGEDYFRQLVRDYQRECPSPAGNLSQAGARLPQFLERRFAGSDYEYFSDVARVERACQEVLGAADHAALDLARLADVPPADHARLRFDLDPAARLVRSVYPAVRIWEAHQGGREPEPIDIGSGGEHALVQRRADGIRVHRLAPAEYACLAALGAGRSLGTALDDALAIDAHFDLPSALRRWGELGFIVDFSVAGPCAIA